MSEYGREELLQRLRQGDNGGRRIPEYMHDPLIGYIRTGQAVGHFLTALLCGDLFAAMDRADDRNIDALPAYGYFLYNYVPSSCYGSKEKVKKWKGIVPRKEDS